MKVRYTFTLMAFVHDDGEDRTRIAQAESLAMAAPKIIDVVRILTGLPIEGIEIRGEEIVPEPPSSSSLN